MWLITCLMRVWSSSPRSDKSFTSVLWSPQVVEILARKLREPPCDKFRVVVLLPQSRTRCGYNPRPGRRLGPRRQSYRSFSRRDDRGPKRRTRGPLYVHAKIGIVDDTWLTVVSANLMTLVLQRHRDL